MTWLQETNQELASTAPLPSEERRKQLEEIRRTLLLEFASTHHNISGTAPWLPPTRSAAGSGNRAGLISPAASEPSATGERPLTDTRLALYTGYGMGADTRRRKTARAHRLALQIAAHLHNPISFDVLYMQIVKVSQDIRALSTSSKYESCLTANLKVNAYPLARVSLIRQINLLTGFFHDYWIPYPVIFIKTFWA